MMDNNNNNNNNNNKKKSGMTMNRKQLQKMRMSRYYGTCRYTQTGK